MLLKYHSIPICDAIAGCVAFKLLGLEVDLGEREEFEKYLNRLFWLRICSSRIQHLNAPESDTFQASR